MGLGPTELIIIFGILLLLFGAKKLPELARGLGRGIREFKDASQEITDEISRADYSSDRDDEYSRERRAGSDRDRDYEPERDTDREGSRDEQREQDRDRPGDAGRSGDESREQREA